MKSTITNIKRLSVTMSMSVRASLMLIGVWMLVGCAQNEIVEKSNNNHKPQTIGFSHLSDKPTRLANEHNHPYGVFAMWNKNSGSTIYMNDVMVTPDNAGTNDSYSPLQFWPQEGSLSFYAYAPHSSLASNRIIWNIDEYETTYTVPTNNVASDLEENGFMVGGAFEDFTLATAKDKTVGNGTVQLQFGHMLSKITVQVELAERYIEADYSLNLKQSYVKLTVSQKTGKIINLNNDTPPELEPQYTEGGDIYNGIFVTLSNNQYIPPQFNIIPQPATDLKLQIKNAVVHEVTGGPINHQNPDNIYWKGDLNEINLGEKLQSEFKFEAGKAYIITLTIGQSSGVFGNVVKFDVQESEWKEENKIEIPENETPQP